MLLAATLVLLLDLQIEPVATAINRYWVWLDGGAYYGVPSANFAAWWAVGLVMAMVVRWALNNENREPRTENQDSEQRTKNKEQRITNKKQRTRTSITDDASRSRFYVLRFTFYAIPAGLYLLNTLMFVVINLARGYTLAGHIGLVVLIAFALATIAVGKRPEVV